MKEEYLLSGQLEPTNAPYSVAKIAGIETCRSFNRQYGTKYLSLMPSNLYGPGDNYNEQNSHVLPALIAKFHQAKVKSLKEVSVWGTGTPKREFLYVDDFANAAIKLIGIEDEIFDSILYNKVAPGLINVGSGVDLSIDSLAELIAKTIDYKGKIIYNTDLPDGTPRKLLDITRVQSIGWKPQISLIEGLKLTYDSYLKEHPGL
jgi:GDP-L-fucose synthase